MNVQHCPQERIKLPIVVKVDDPPKDLEVPIGWYVLPQDAIIMQGDLCANIIEPSWMSITDPDFVPYLTEDEPEAYVDVGGKRHFKTTPEEIGYDVVIRQWPWFKKALRAYRSDERVRHDRVLYARERRRMHGYPDMTKPKSNDWQNFQQLERDELWATIVLFCHAYNVEKPEVLQRTIDSLRYKLEIIDGEMFGHPGMPMVVCSEQPYENLDSFWYRLAEENFKDQFGLS